MALSTQFRPQHKALYLAVGLALGGIAPIAQAVPITVGATASWSVGGVPGAGDSDGPVTTPPFASVDILGGDGNPGGSVFYHTFGNSAGVFGSRVSGDGTFDITGAFSYSENVTNTSGVAQNYGFDFNVIPGEIRVDSFGPLSLGDFAAADYSIEVMLTTTAGTTSVFDSAANIGLDDSGVVSFADTGSSSLGGVFSPFPGGGQYSWLNVLFSLDLGVFAPGESFTLDYLLTTNASGRFDGPCGFGGGEGEFFLAAIDGGEGCVSAGSRSGDPLGGQGFGNTLTLTQVAVVPEPGSLLLMGAAAFGLGAMRKRKGVKA